MVKETPRYTTIIHKIRIELDLSCNEYCVADIIFSLSNNPDAKVLGWCFATKETIAGFMGISKQTIHEIINRLIEKKLVEKDPESKYLKTTSLWYQSVVLERLKMKNMLSKEILPIVRKGDHTSKETLLHRVRKGDSYNNSYNNNNKNKDNISPTEIEKSPPSYGNEDINTLYAFLRDELGGSPDGSQKENRRFAYLLLNRFKKDYPDKNPVELVKFLIQAGIKDSFHGKNITNFKYLYYNAQKIIMSAKSQILNPKYIKI